MRSLVKPGVGELELTRPRHGRFDLVDGVVFGAGAMTASSRSLPRLVRAGL